MIVVLTEHNTNRFEHVVPLFTEQSCLYARRDRAEQLAARHYDLEGERINIGGYAVETMCQLLALDQYQKIHVVDGWHVESSLMLTRAGTHLSFCRLTLLITISTTMIWSHCSLSAGNFKASFQWF